MKLMQLFCSAVLVLPGALAQQNPISADIKGLHDTVKGYILKSADKMPEADYAYRPSPDVRSFGQLLGHIADAQYLFCSAVKGEKPPAPAVEKTKSSKAELTAALNEAFGYCDSAYTALTDASGGEIVKFFGRERSKAGVLAFNNNHNFEHYGNLVTYLRMKGIVPPSSDRR